MIRTRSALFLAALIVASLSAPPAAWGDPPGSPQRLPVVLPQCVAGYFAPGVVTPSDAEFAGPTDVNAETANRSLAVGMNREGTVTVFRWPRPSFYNQIKYFSFDRHARYEGALPNEGAFLGVVIGRVTSWLRDWPVRQRFSSADGDEVITRYERRGIRVTVFDVAAHGHDVLARRVVVRTLPIASETPTAVVAFEHFDPVFGKAAGLPGQDWCTDQFEANVASYDSSADAIVHSSSGVDESTGKLSSVAVAMGFAGHSSQHQVGGDAYEATASPDGRTGPTVDAYVDASDGTLSGNGAYAGQATGALEAPLRFRDGAASAELYVGAGPDPAAAIGQLRDGRLDGERRLAAAKQRWLDSLLRRAPLPDTRDPKILDLAKRDLVLLLTNADPAGPFVASITTQPPYGEDWPRDGSFIDDALDRAGYTGLALRHNLFYARTQATETSQPRGSFGVPPGNWAMNYYADGVNGGPIPWEIDETGFTVWSMWRHYAATGDLPYLRRVYPAIGRGADFLVQCTDPQTGLQCYGTEDDNFAVGQERTLLGAATTWMGLDRAERAARALGRRSDAARYAARKAELGRAIDSVFWNGHDYGGSWGGGAYLVWPARFRPYDDPRIRAQAEYLWREVRPSFEAPHGPRTSGSYEGKALMALALVYRHTDPAKLRRVREGLRWIAHVQATPGTGLLGESWKVQDGKVLTITAMPHLWEHTLFYLAALEAYGSSTTAR